MNMITKYRFGLTLFFCLISFFYPVGVFSSVFSEDFRGDTLGGQQEMGKEYSRYFRSYDSLHRKFSGKHADSIFFLEMKAESDQFLKKGFYFDAIRLINHVLGLVDGKLNASQDIFVDPDFRKMLFDIKMTFMVSLGAAYEESGIRSKAMDIYQEALLLIDHDDTSPYRIQLYNNIANIYYKMGSLEKAERYWNEALDLCRILGENKEISNLYNNLAGLNFERGGYSKALEYLMISQQEVLERRDTASYHLLRLNMARAYGQLGELSLSVTMVKDALDYFDKNGLQSLEFESLFFLSTLYFSSGDYKQSLYYAEKSEDLAIELGLPENLLMSLRQEYSIFRKENESAKALEISDAIIRLQDSIRTLTSQRSVENTEVLYKMEREAREREGIINQLTINNLEVQKQRMTFVFLGGLLLIIIFFVLYKYRSTVKLKKMGEELFLQQESLYKQEKQWALNREKELVESLELRDKELASKVLSIIRNNEFVISMGNELQDILGGMKTKDEMLKSRIRSMMLRLRSQSSEDAFSEFQYYFERVHHSFYDNLKQRYPQLTQKDLRLCALLRLGLTTKEISTITFREVRSVESSRNRLRRKMNLNSSVDLMEFLSEF